MTYSYTHLPGFAARLTSLIHAAKTAGLDSLSPTEMDLLISALAKIAPDMQRIIPDRRYSIDEIAEGGYGPRKGRLYKAHKHLIKKEGRSSYVLGRDLLALQEAAPSLTSSPAQPPVRRPRGRPRKPVAEPAVKAAGTGDE